jgi:hypothetical protein
MLRPSPASPHLIGGFRPDMREADDEAIRRSSVFVDTREGAGTEAGDIVVPMRLGILHPDGIRADLHDLASGRHAGRRQADEITVFKSVGAALEDFTAAVLVYERHADSGMDVYPKGSGHPTPAHVHSTDEGRAGRVAEFRALLRRQTHRSQH